MEDRIYNSSLFTWKVVNGRNVGYPKEHLADAMTDRSFTVFSVVSARTGVKEKFMYSRYESDAYYDVFINDDRNVEVHFSF